MPVKPLTLRSPAAPANTKWYGEPVARMDFETYSAAELKKVGAFRYAQDASTEVLCLAYRLPGQEINLWVPTLEGVYPWPDELAEWVLSGGKVDAFNAEFEFCIWNYLCAEKHGFPKIEINQLACSAARAAALAFPRNLDGVGDALELPIRKDKEGHKLMLKLSKPKRATKKDPATRNLDADELDRLYDYCMQDVRAEEAVAAKLPALSADSQKLWEFTLRMNDRGLKCDVALCKTALRFATLYAQELHDELYEITDGKIRTAKQNAKIKSFLEDREVFVENMQADTVDLALKQKIADPVARRVLEIRQALGKASTSKYLAMLNSACSDGRIRGTLLFWGASTGRYAGKGIQIQNFIKGKFKDVANILALLEDGDYEFFRAVFPDVMTALASSLRAMITVEPGNILYAGDYNAVEARIICWLAGEEAALAAFKTGADLYIDMAADVYDKSPKEIVDAERQLGKQVVLGCGFGMGWKKFMETCAKYKIVITAKLAKKAVKAYRSRYQNVKAFWYALDDAAKAAIKNPGRLQKCGHLQLLVKDGFLQMRLPSGRKLSYFKPRIVMGKWPDKKVKEKDGTVRVVKGAPKEEIAFLSVDAKTRRWQLERTYGAKLAENATQACAADLMTDALQRLEVRGYPPVTSVHDEAVCETKETYGNLEEFLAIMAEVPSWARGLPVKVGGWREKRYKK